jgi:putative FmdB family regulatory protein
VPIYAYRCEACGFEQDVLQKMSDAPLKECPSCHAQALQKQVTAAGFQLKGSGWYATDFRNNNAPAAKADAPAKSDGGEGGEGTKSDGAKTEGAKTEGAKTEGAKGDASVSDKAGSSSPPPVASSGSSDGSSSSSGHVHGPGCGHA